MGVVRAFLWSDTSAIRVKKCFCTRLNRQNQTLGLSCQMCAFHISFLIGSPCFLKISIWGHKQMVTIGRLANADRMYFRNSFEHLGKGNAHINGTL